MSAIESIEHDKMKNMMLAHLDGVYVFSARPNCDALVTELIRLLMASKKELKDLRAEISKSGGILA